MLQLRGKYVSQLQLEPLVFIFYQHRPTQQSVRIIVLPLLHPYVQNDIDKLYF